MRRNPKVEAFDAVVVGGSFAGLSAALQLVRARRRVLLVDGARPRNRFAAHSYGLLGHDGRPPQDIVADALGQLEQYPTFSLRRGSVQRAARGDDNESFALELGDGSTVRGTRVVLAFGVTDVLPELAGLQERWGATVAMCPYCHGYELAGGRIGVLSAGALSAHQAALLPDWGPTTYFTQGQHAPTEGEAQRLTSRGVHIVDVPVVALLGDAPALTGVRLADGRTVPLSGLFVATVSHPASPLGDQLGCALVSTPAGPRLHVDAWQRTSVPGVFAAGDVATPMASAAVATAAGALAGIGAHQSLVFGLSPAL